MQISLLRNLRPGRLTLQVKVAIFLAICLLDILLGRMADFKLLLLVVAGIVGLIILVILMRYPEWGILAILPVSFFGKWSIGTGTNVAFNLSILLIIFLVGIWLMRMLLFEHSVRLVNSTLNPPAVSFIVILILSFIVGNIQWILQASAKASFLAQFGGWLLYFLSICTLLLPGNLIKDHRFLRIVVWEFLILGFIKIYSEQIHFTTKLINLFFVDAGPLGSTFFIWIAAFATSYLVFCEKLERKRVLFMLLLLGALFYRGWIQYREWVSGWGPPLIAVIVILWLRNWRLAGAALLIGGVIIGLQYSALSSTVMTDTQQYSVYSRSATWPILFELIKASPVFGLGPANYHFYTPLFSLLGWHVQFNSHNNYLDIVAQYGFAGLAIFFWLIFAIARLAWRLKNQVQDEFSKVYVYACIGGLVAMLASGLLGDWFLPFLYNISTGGFRFSVVSWLFLGGLVVIERELSNKVA